MVARNDSETEITQQEFQEIINENHKLVVVDFFAEWCMPCIMLAPIIQDIAEERREIKFVKVSVDESQELVEKYKVSSVPTLIMFKEGREVSRMRGIPDKELIEDKIDGLTD